MTSALTCTDSILPPSPSGPRWLRECLDAAFPIEGAASRPAFPWRLPRLPATPSTRRGERRRDTRAPVAVYRSAMLRWSGAESLCLIRNISSGGVMAKLPAPPAVGVAVSVELRSGHRLDGTVVWRRTGELGIQLAEPIDVGTVLGGSHLGSPHWRQRMPRLAVGEPAMLQVHDSLQPVTLLDLSQGGAKVEAVFLRVGDEVALAVKGLEPHRGTVCWVRDGRAGIAFLRAIPFDLLAAWAAERQGL